jgi:hypothetical protein
MGGTCFRLRVDGGNLQPALQNVHQIPKTERSPEALAFGVATRNPDFAALDAPPFDPGERALDKRAAEAAAALVRVHHQIRDLGAPNFQLDGGGAVDPDAAEAQQGASALADEDRCVRIAQDRGEQSVDLRIRVGAQGKEQITRRVMLAERDPERRDPIEVARVRAANAPAVSLRDRGLRQLASS